MFLGVQHLMVTKNKELVSPLEPQRTAPEVCFISFRNTPVSSLPSLNFRLRISGVFEVKIQVRVFRSELQVMLYLKETLFQISACRQRERVCICFFSPKSSS